MATQSYRLKEPLKGLRVEGPLKVSALSLMLLFASFAPASEIKFVNWGTEAWKGYTDRDGSGIYTQLLQRAFGDRQVELNVSYMPFARTLHLVKIGKLDFAGGIAKDSKPHSDYIQARYPIAVTRMNALFHKSAVDQWRGLQSLKGRKLVATPSQAEQLGLDPSEVYVVDNREQALRMLLNGRAEFFFDDEKVLEATIAAHNDEFDVNDYRIETVGSNGYYMIAPNTERGRRIMDIYEQQTLRLYRSGELKQLYDRFGFSTPDIIE